VNTQGFELNPKTKNDIKFTLDQVLDSECALYFYRNGILPRWRIDVCFANKVIEFSGGCDFNDDENSVSCEISDPALIIGTWVICYLDKEQKSSELIGDYEMSQADHKRLEALGFKALNAIKAFIPILNAQVSD